MWSSALHLLAPFKFGIAVSLLDDTLEVCDVIREQLNGNSADGGTGGIVRLEGS